MSITFETSIKGWRIADGKIIRGRGKGGEEQLEMISGKLKRIGVHEGTTDDGDTYKQLEVDLDTDDGPASLKAAIGLAPTASNVTPFMFAQGLLAVALNEHIAIKPERSKEAHEKWGTYTTFVNVGIVDPVTLKAKAVKEPKESFVGESSKEKLLDALERLAKHPAYAPRPKRDDEGGGEQLSPSEEYTGFLIDIAAKGWPDPSFASSIYCDMAGKLAGTTFSEMSEIPEDIYKKLREGVASAKALPKALEPAVKAAKDAEEHDPFA